MMKSTTTSRSMPDMSALGDGKDGGETEESKRAKRLARNRASARLRRLKKKNLVDAYEAEVGVLTAALAKLRAHRWGAGIDHEQLVDALSMERGNQPLDAEQRRELIQSLVLQQKEMAENLLEEQLENWLLAEMVGGNLSAADARSAMSGSDADELNRLTSELDSVLRLTPDQKSRIQQSSTGCVEEVNALFTVVDCLDRIHKNEWLLDTGVDDVAGQFTSILNPAQLSKFLLWADHNKDQIDQLDYLNVPPGGPASEPIFEFGIDEGLHEAVGDS